MPQLLAPFRRDGAGCLLGGKCRCRPGGHDDVDLTRLALLWQIKGAACAVGFPNRVLNDSWVVGFWRADHGRHDVGLGRRAWALAQAIPGSLGPQGAATDVSAL